MNILLKMGLVLMLGLSLAPMARAEPPANVQIEVNFLLGYVDGDAALVGCLFPTHTPVARELLLDEVIPAALRFRYDDAIDLS